MDTGVFITLEQRVLNEARRRLARRDAAALEQVELIMRGITPRQEYSEGTIGAISRAIRILHDHTSKRVAETRHGSRIAESKHAYVVTLQESLVARIHAAASAAGVGVGRGAATPAPADLAYVELAREAIALATREPSADIAAKAADIDRRAEAIRPASADVYATGEFDLELVCARLGLRTPVAGSYVDGVFAYSEPVACELQDRVGALAALAASCEKRALGAESRHDLCSLAALVALRAAA